MFFIPKHIDINVVHYFYFSVTFLCHWKGNTGMTQFFYVFLITSFNPLRVFLLWMQMPNMTPSKALIIFILAGFRNPGGSSIYDDPFNGLYFTMFIYSSSVDSTVHAMSNSLITKLRCHLVSLDLMSVYFQLFHFD